MTPISWRICIRNDDLLQRYSARWAAGLGLLLCWVSGSQRDTCCEGVNVKKERIMMSLVRRAAVAMPSRAEQRAM
jgi:hypothetical protein